MNDYILIGYMGSGKSSVKEVLKKAYGIDGVDTDDMIEKMQGLSISNIFETKGEEYFRKLEEQVIKRLLDSDKKMVIATGGGLPIYNKDLLLKEKGVIYLRAKKETLINRLVNDTKRPLLSDESKDIESLDKKIDDMLKKRAPIYEEVADIIIDVDEKTIEQIVEEITIKARKDK